MDQHINIYMMMKKGMLENEVENEVELLSHLSKLLSKDPPLTPNTHSEYFDKAMGKEKL